MPFLPNIKDILEPETIDEGYPRPLGRGRPPRKRSRISRVQSRSAQEFSASPLPESVLSVNNAAFVADSNDEGVESDIRHHRRTPRTSTLSHVSIPGSAFPPSAFEGWKPPMEKSSEYHAVRDLKSAAQAHAAQTQSHFVYLRLDQFSIYRPPNCKHAHELASLDKLLMDGSPLFLVDGIISQGDERRYVQGVPFQTLTIDGYLDPENIAVAEGSICLQSKIGAYEGIWYQLGRPSPTYQRFYTPFLWLVQFTKLFVQYLSEHEMVTLAFFRQRFHKWLTDCYLGQDLDPSNIIATWLSQASLRDFRTTVTANLLFIRKECFSIDDQDLQLFDHPLWGEIDYRDLKAIPMERPIERQTIVTPFAYQCFREMYFGDQLEARSIESPAIRDAVASRKQKMRLTPHTPSQAPAAMPNLTPGQLLNVHAGDVVCVQPDGIGWAKSTLSDVWYAYVQRVKTRKSGAVKLDVLWLYSPCDTTLGKAFYPFKNELFLSDNCSCGREALDLKYVTGKAEVTWFADAPTDSGLFVRQKFRTVAEDDTFDFVRLSESDFSCSCNETSSIWDDIRKNYSVNDTIIYRDQEQYYLQVAQIVGFDRATKIQLRRLRRKTELEGQAQPNELIVTNEFIEISARACIRHCHVRYIQGDDIPHPYDRKGVGDFFFIKSEESSAAPPPITQGWIPTEEQPKRKLRGMGIFCGGGTFDRGVEEGGGVEFRYAVDYAQHALHTYRANATRKVHYFLGSVDDYLAQAFAGRADDRIAQPGDFDILTGGSPCQGFSFLQQDKNSPTSRRNASRIASVVSFVDFYSPKYLLLENVVNLTRNFGPNKDENVFSQLLAALVALGYQVQQFLMDAWLYSSPQRRSRVFIIATAPGLKPLEQPPVSHAHPSSKQVRSTALGTSASGLRFGVRYDHFTPFGPVSARDAVSDLPDIGDAQVQLCPAFPDHRTASAESAESRARMAMVPVRPSAMGLMQAYYNGLLRGEPLAWCERSNPARKHPDSKLYGRIDFLFPTIATKVQPADARNGRFLHWIQHRIITVMETRRAQGIPDHEVIIGSPAQQIETIGNGVERNTSFVLGLRIRESWMFSGR